MPRNLIAPEPWWPDAADLMVRYDRSLLEAAAKLKMRPGAAWPIESLTALVFGLWVFVGPLFSPSR
jgi:hypothetical protein